MYTYKNVLTLVFSLAALALFAGCGHYRVPGKFEPLEAAQQRATGEGTSMKILDDGTVTFVQNRLEVSVRPMTDEEINRQYPASLPTPAGLLTNYHPTPSRTATGSMHAPANHRSVFPSSKLTSRTTNIPRSSSTR